LVGDDTEEKGVGEDGGHAENGETGEPAIESGAVDESRATAAGEFDEVHLDLHHVVDQSKSWSQREHHSEHGKVAELDQGGEGEQRG
jgi:hypothetical protein